ncbi:MAG: N-formylglutamate amidohydrolase [Herminiimonas sp.]|nr:N-formylglutamate amidohydrolase [Herminiimonas sp.]MDB5852342.1 N-formylglutamate amidohydrolase [Herminiimonas sp.]
MQRSGRIGLRGAAASTVAVRQAIHHVRLSTRRTRRKARLLVTCEHGGNHIPPKYAPLFKTGAGILASHRGYDDGALTLAVDLSQALAAPLHYSTVSRLLVDLNRSASHVELHSTFTAGLTDAHRAGILEHFYIPYRTEVEEKIDRWIKAGEQVVHVSCHSFTPFMHGRLRCVEIGFLFDAARPRELAICTQWRRALQRTCHGLRIRLNAPYNGASDGFTTTLRQRHGPEHYAGIEIEINQRLVHGKPKGWRRLRHALIEALAS